MTRYFIWNEDEKIENEKFRNIYKVAHNGHRDDHMAVYELVFDVDLVNSDGSKPKWTTLNGKKVKLFETLGEAILELPTIETGFNTFDNATSSVIRYFVMPGEGRPDTEYKIEKMREALNGKYYIYSIFLPTILQGSRYITFPRDTMLREIRVPLFVFPWDAEKFVEALEKLYCKYEVRSKDVIVKRTDHIEHFAPEDCSGFVQSGETSIGKSFLDDLEISFLDTCVPEIKEVKFNPPATIVFWDDGTKTVVKTRNGEKFDPEKGLAMAISKKALGNGYDYYESFEKEVGKYNKKMKKLSKVLEKKEKHTEVKKEIKKSKKSYYPRRRKL